MRGCAGNCVFYSGLLSFLKKGICDHAHTVSHSFGQSNLPGAVFARPKKRREGKNIAVFFMTSTFALARHLKCVDVSEMASFIVFYFHS
jgi:hypothetical protein